MESTIVWAKRKAYSINGVTIRRAGIQCRHCQLAFEKLWAQPGVFSSGATQVAAPHSDADLRRQIEPTTLSVHCGSNTVTAQAKVTVDTLTLHVIPPPVFHLLFNVTGASASKNVWVCDSHGTATVKFNGTITTNGSGDVTYKWEDSNAPSAGTVQTLHFSSATTLSVPQYQVSISWTGQKYIHVLTPNDLISNKLTYGCPYSP